MQIFGLRVSGKDTDFSPYDCDCEQLHFSHYNVAGWFAFWHLGCDSMVKLAHQCRTALKPQVVQECQHAFAKRLVVLIDFGVVDRFCGCVSMADSRQDRADDQPS
jgi:hypothetical protein